MFKLGVTLETGNIAKGFENVVDHARGVLISALKENIDKNAKASWVDQGGPLTKSGGGDKYMISDAKFGPKQYVEVLQELYVQAFKSRYNKIQEAHRREAPQPQGEAWVDSKRWKRGSPSPWNHKSIGEQVDGQIDYAIMTGFLRKSILDVFNGEETNKYFEFDNPMLRGAWRWNIEEYQFKGFNYVQKITEYFIDELGILDDEQDLVDLPENELQDIGKQMMRFLEGGFSQDFVKRMEEMDIEITPDN